MSIEVRHVSKSFGAFKALDDVSLRINGGELVALLGPSGSGKTTLLRLIAGLETPDEDSRTSVLFHDQDVSDAKVAERRVGFVFQHYALFRHMTVFDNIAFGLRVKHRSERLPADRIKAKVERLLELVQLKQFGGRFPSQLSGGQRQRVALARALAVEPKVLLLDEPFGALDAKVRQDLRQWLRRLHEQMHVTTVLVTHDQEEALEVSDRVVVMNHGKIEQDGSPDELFHNAQTQFVMEFLGHVNMFHGRAVSGFATAGPLRVEFPNYPSDEAAPARVYFRPHDLEVRRRPNGDPSLAVTVRRINTAGSLGRVSLTTLDGVPVLVEMTLDELRELALKQDELVHLYPKQAKVFLDGSAVGHEAKLTSPARAVAS